MDNHDTESIQPPCGRKTCDDFLSLAAHVFGVAADSLSPDTRMGDIPEWDSVNHLRLVMESEKAFGIRFGLEDIPALRTLSDFIARLDQAEGMEQ